MGTQRRGSPRRNVRREWLATMTPRKWSPRRDPKRANSIMPSGSCTRGRVMVDADTDPPRISREVVDPVWHRATQFLDQEVMDRDFFRVAWGRYSRPLLRKSPTSSFFLVSTEITGCCSAIAVVTWVLM